MTEEAGIRFKHQDGASGRKYFAEVMSPGGAFTDLTGDGKPDLYLINGAPLPGVSAPTTWKDRFYKNKGDGTFEDLTGRAGLGDTGYGVGCCVGDFDNDGLPDLYVTNLGRNTLYRNLGGGRFQDVTGKAGVGAKGYSTGCAFADYDRDGDLDLYVCRYVDWTPQKNIACTTSDGDKQVLVYCRPTVYPPASNVLYRNNGNGTFTDVTSTAGVAGALGRSLGCLWGDWDDDGDFDLFVANDMSANFLFINDGKGKFTEEALSRGVALGEGGRAHAGMGVSSVDYDNDGLFDLQVTNFSGQYLAMYRNVGGGHFEDVSAQTGVAEATAPYVGFGLSLGDFDLDGIPDLFVANGHVTEAAEQYYPGVTLSQPNLFLLGSKNGRFTKVAGAGDGVSTPNRHRGLATADYDGDGDLDMIVMNWNDAPDLIRNDTPQSGNHWLRIALRGNPKARSNSLGLDARVTVTAGSLKQVQEVRSGGSYCSQNDLALTFGLGAATTVDKVEVRWPSGERQAFRGPAIDKTHTLAQP